MSVVLSLLALCVLIFVHELGHFLVAKWNKVGVHEFAIGFGPKLCSFTFKKTLYSIRWIPLGGYVRMAGETSSDLETAEKDLFTFDKDEHLNNKKVWQRAAIVFAGPLFNILFAIIATIAVISIYGVYDLDDANRIGAVIPDSSASKAGLEDNDIVISINGERTEKWIDIVEHVRTSEGKALKFLIERNGQTLSFELVPTLEDKDLQYIQNRHTEDPRYQVGIMAPYKRKTIGFPDVIWEGFNYSKVRTYNIIRSVKGLITGNISSDKIGGPIQIISIASKKAKKSFDEFLMLVVEISLSLAILNLLPIPILDGGHLMFLGIEAVIRKPLPQNVQATITNTVGLFLIASLFLLATYNDISKLIMN